MDRFEGSWVYETAEKPPEQSDTISGLAEKLGLDPEKLEADRQRVQRGLRLRQLGPD